jgi:hypothetical protein
LQNVPSSDGERVVKSGTCSLRHGSASDLPLEPRLEARSEAAVSLEHPSVRVVEAALARGSSWVGRVVVDAEPRAFGTEALGSEKVRFILFACW